MPSADLLMDARTASVAAWWARPRQAQETWIGNYQRSLKNRHRDVIVDIIRETGATSVLELGCHCGPNLVRLAQEVPALTSLSGVDVNQQAIDAGTLWMAELGLSERVELAAGRIPDRTLPLADGCVDVVLSCYALAYVAPADLDAVLFEMGRLATRAIVMAEPMTEDAEAVDLRGTRLDGYAEWAHNYRAASRWIGSWSGMTLTTRVIDPPVDRLDRVLVLTRA